MMIRELKFKNEPINDDVFYAVQCIPQDMVEALEAADGESTYLHSDILFIQKLCNESAKSYWKANPHLENQAIYLIDFEFYELSDWDRDWFITELDYSRYQIVADEETILDRRVVISPGELNHLDINDADTGKIAILDERLPNSIFSDLIDTIIQHYEDEMLDEEFLDKYIEPMLELPNPEEEERLLIKRVQKPLRAAFIEFFTPLKHQHMALLDIKKQHPIFNPDSIELTKEEENQHLTLKCWYERHWAKVLVQDMPSKTKPAKINIELYESTSGLLGRRNLLRDSHIFDFPVTDPTLSSTQILEMLFKTGVIENQASIAFQEILKIYLPANQKDTRK